MSLQFLFLRIKFERSATRLQTTTYSRLYVWSTSFTLCPVINRCLFFNVVSICYPPSTIQHPLYTALQKKRKYFSIWLVWQSTINAFTLKIHKRYHQQTNHSSNLIKVLYTCWPIIYAIFFGYIFWWSFTVFLYAFSKLFDVNSSVQRSNLIYSWICFVTWKMEKLWIESNMKCL